MRYDRLDSEVHLFLRRLVRRKARQLVRHCAFSKSDREDIAQELTICVLASLERFDPTRGTIFSFIYTIVERKAATLRRYHAAAKRDSMRCGSLSVDVREDDGVRVELASTITEDAPSLRLFQRFRHAQYQSERNLDLDTVIARLPRRERDVCLRLKTASPSQVARQLRIPRASIYEIIGKIRCHLAAECLDEYR